MTKICWAWLDELDIFAVAAEGHAGDAVVCSAISALLQTLHRGLLHCCGEKVAQGQDEAIFYLSGCGTREPIRTLFHSIVLGLEEIAAAYPENVEIFGVGDKGRLYGVE